MFQLFQYGTFQRPTMLRTRMYSKLFFFQAETHLCRRFTVFVIKYNLMSKDNIIVPILEESNENSTVSGTSQGESDA